MQTLIFPTERVRVSEVWSRAVVVRVSLESGASAVEAGGGSERGECANESEEERE